MTAPSQKIFNPNLFKAPASAEEKGELEPSGSDSRSTEKEYPTTGNATRDQVRKFLFESFQTDKPVPGEKLSIRQVVQEVENSIFGKFIRFKKSDIWLYDL